MQPLSPRLVFADALLMQFHLKCCLNSFSQVTCWNLLSLTPGPNNVENKIYYLRCFTTSCWSKYGIQSWLHNAT